MKQHITASQLNELSEKGKERLRKEFPISEDGGLQIMESTMNPLPSIGQMIEFLNKYQHNNSEGVGPYWTMRLIGEKERWAIDMGRWDDKVIESKELCDALWEAVKEILEEQGKI